MRHLDEIVIHCTATTGDDAGDVDIDTVRRWHTRAPRSWSDVGYHYLVRRDGSVEVGRPLSRPGAHVRGHNASTIGIVYTGGIDADTGEHSDTRTDDQREQSYSERQLYEAALDRMARELAAVEKLDEASAVAKIDDVLAKSARTAKAAQDAETAGKAAA